MTTEIWVDAAQGVDGGHPSGSHLVQNDVGARIGLVAADRERVIDVAEELLSQI